MRLSKYSHKYLNWGYKVVISIVTLFVTLVTKSHEPSSMLKDDATQCRNRQELAVGLHSALLYGHASAEVVSILVEAGADINQAAEKPEFLSPFGLVCAFLSLRHHWRPSALSTYARNVAGATPLICSILSGSFEAAAVLISAGASLELSNHEGKTVRDFLNPASAPEFLVKAIGGCPAACDAVVAEHVHV